MDPPLHAQPIDARALGLPARRQLALAGVVPPAPRLAIVGSRAAHRDRIVGVDAAVAVAKMHGLAIVSGGALGIDAAAHRAALAHGVPQLAVLPCGPDLPYPAQHLPLFEAIVGAGGGVLFGRPRGAPPNRGVFASRNAIVVALAERVLLAQAATPSGSLSTARKTLAAGKPLAVFGGQPTATALARRGATRITFPAPVAALKAELEAWLWGQSQAAPAWPAALERLQAAITVAGAHGLSIDGLTPRMLVLLLQAEAQGLVAEQTPGRYVAIR